MIQNVSNLIMSSGTVIQFSNLIDYTRVQLICGTISAVSTLLKMLSLLYFQLYRDTVLKELITIWFNVQKQSPGGVL